MLLTTENLVRLDMGQRGFVIISVYAENDPVTGTKSMRKVQAKQKDCLYGCFIKSIHQTLCLLLGLIMSLNSQAGPVRCHCLQMRDVYAAGSGGHF